MNAMSQMFVRGLKLSPRILRGSAVACAVLLVSQTASAGPLQNLRARLQGGGQDAGWGYQVAPNTGGQVLQFPEGVQTASGSFDPNTGQPLFENGRGRPIIDMVGGIAVRSEESMRLQQILNRGNRPVFELTSREVLLTRFSFESFSVSETNTLRTQNVARVLTDLFLLPILTIPRQTS